MDAKAALVGTAIAFITVPFKVAAVGVVVSAQDAIVTASVANPATVHRSVDITHSSITRSRHLRVGTKMPASR